MIVAGSRKCWHERDSLQKDGVQGKERERRKAENYGGQIAPKFGQCPLDFVTKAA